MNITFIVREIPYCYNIRQLVDGIADFSQKEPTITLYPGDNHSQNTYYNAWSSRDLPIDIFTNKYTFRVDLISMRTEYNLSVKGENVDYSRALMKCLSSIEQKYKDYRRSCTHPIMDNYPAYRLLENLIINNTEAGSFEYKNYSVYILFGVEIWHDEKVIYTNEEIDWSDLIIKFTNEKLHEEFYIADSHTKSARKIIL
jgi:hypothetical protein